jgi:hypothetical protein
MKKYMLIVLAVSLTALAFPKDVTPVFSVRYDDMTTGVAVTDAIGLQTDIGGGRFTGFDTDGTDYRIYVGWGFGKIGFGSAANGDEEFTAGATYEVLENLSLDLDYILAKAQIDQNLRLSLNIHF